MQDGIIIKGIGGFYYVLSEGKIIECKARGVFRKENIKPLAGDRVKISVNGEKGSIEEILERKNFLIRPPVANIDTLVLVIASKSPNPDLTLIDKILVNAEIRGIESVLCINKSDLCQRADIEEIYTGAGYKVIHTSAKGNENIDEIKKLLKGKITAFTGLSGVGKSSLLNLITDSEMETGALSEKIERGKNTTRHSELLPIEDGFVLDTPGFSSLEVEAMPEAELIEYFPEMRELSGLCKYRGCSHKKEVGCEILEALEKGEIAESRYNSYIELYDFLKAKNSY